MGSVVTYLGTQLHKHSLDYLYEVHPPPPLFAMGLY